ncbi:hypothetical protein HF324_04670 [Chitinophaga oryzae]|uniref:Uncharacterized protein n=1 Tax=Chitinophaga oryzae TaxID=2725414 RepID=A0AAE6ZD46_9BACT|nr:hypothetical protein [Chitinophaga oryzae]QJB30683.1 hypothetical protein HF329_04965 [Chitinophaga oryzae]QJB37183.1 hypothetical protein HF324_04670 [Chitinophaga oryzae]
MYQTENQHFSEKTARSVPVLITPVTCYHLIIPEDIMARSRDISSGYCV